MLLERPKVAVIKCTPETILDDIERLMYLADFEKFLDKSKPVILKDNISWHLPFLSANTTPWQLEGVIRTLAAAGYHKIVAVHNETVVTRSNKGQRLNKLDKLYKRYAIKELHNFKPNEIKWVIYKPKTKMRVLHKIYPEGILIPEYFIGKNIIHLPTVKTHIYTTTTGAMKNAFGGLLNTKRHYTHSVIHDTLVDLLAIQKEIHSGIFAVMDGTICGEGPGPRTMTPHEKDYMLASGDSVAIDAVAAKMMGFDPIRDLKYVRVAHEEELGVGDIEEIEVIGEDIRGINFGFKVGDNMASLVGDTFWFSPLKFLQKPLFQTPLVYIFIFGSFIYHDYIWWPLKGKKIQAKLRKESKWGRLFEKY